MIKKIIFFLLILSLTSCGYQPIYTKKNYDALVIKEYQLAGDKIINRKIVSLLNLRKNIQLESSYILSLDSVKKLETVAKDKTGKASVFKTSITVSIKINENKTLIKEKIFNKTYTYNNTKNKFDLLQYQKDIENNILDKISEEIIIFLNT
jgi:ribosome-interacting GTPase 1